MSISSSLSTKIGAFAIKQAFFTNINYTGEGHNNVVIRVDIKKERN